MKLKKLKKFPTKLGALFLSVQVICFTFFNSTAFADRAQAEKRVPIFRLYRSRVSFNYHSVWWVANP